MDKKKRLLRDKLDIMTSNEVRERDGECLLWNHPDYSEMISKLWQESGCNPIFTKLTNHHWIHKRDCYKYRFDIRNGMTLSLLVHGLVEDGKIPYEIVKGIALYNDIISESELEEIENDNNNFKWNINYLEDCINKRRES